MSYVPAPIKDFDDSYKKQVLGLIQERLKYLSEIPELTKLFFEDLPVDSELISNNKQLGQIDKDQLKEWLTQAKDSLKDSDFSVQDLTDRLNKLLETTGQKPGILFSLIRIATTQSPSSPGLAESMNVLGKDLSLSRIETQLAAL